MSEAKPISALFCPRCGSQQLNFAAIAIWEIDKQDWGLMRIQDNVSCENCGRKSKYYDEVTVKTKRLEHSMRRHKDLQGLCCQRLFRRIIVYRILLEEIKRILDNLDYSIHNGPLTRKLFEYFNGLYNVTTVRLNQAEGFYSQKSDDSALSTCEDFK